MVLLGLGIDLPYVVIWGQHRLIGANAVVIKDVPAYSIAVGASARNLPRKI